MTLGWVGGGGGGLEQWLVALMLILSALGAWRRRRSSDASKLRVIRSGEGLDAYEFATLRRLEDYCMQEGHEHHWVW